MTKLAWAVAVAAVGAAALWRVRRDRLQRDAEVWADATDTL